MAGHYSAGWSMDSAPSLQAAQDALDQGIVGDKAKAWLGKVSRGTVGRLRPAPAERP